MMSRRELGKQTERVRAWQAGLLIGSALGAAATVAGHLIECGAQVTGGYSSCLPVEKLVDVGYPVADSIGGLTAAFAISAALVWKGWWRALGAAAGRVHSGKSCAAAGGRCDWCGW